MKKKKQPKRKRSKTVNYSPPKELLLVDRKPLYELGEWLTKTTANRYLKQYKKDPCWELDGKPMNCILYGKANIIKLLNQPDCHGLRIFFAKNDKGSPTLVMVGTYSDGSNIVQHTLINDGGLECPEECDDNDNNPFGG